MQTILPSQTKIRRAADGALKMKLDGQCVRLGDPRRALPLSHPDEYILLLDELGEELGIVRNVSELDDESQRVLRDVLSRTYVIERIVRVIEVDREPLSGQTRWRVEIARSENSDNHQTPDADSHDTSTHNGNGAPDMNNNDGDHHDQQNDARLLRRLLRRNRDDEYDEATEEREFFIAGAEDVQTARYPHIFIVDTQRNRYEILDCETLDIDSRKAAERFF
jgi:hypothetical protein